MEPIQGLKIARFSPPKSGLTAGQTSFAAVPGRQHNCLPSALLHSDEKVTFQTPSLTLEGSVCSSLALLPSVEAAQRGYPPPHSPSCPALPPHGRLRPGYSAARNLPLSLNPQPSKPPYSVSAGGHRGLPAHRVRVPEVQISPQGRGGGQDFLLAGEDQNQAHGDRDPPERKHRLRGQHVRRPLAFSSSYQVWTPLPSNIHRDDGLAVLTSPASMLDTNCTTPSLIPQLLVTRFTPSATHGQQSACSQGRSTALSRSDTNLFDLLPPVRRGRVS
jgi:hypothetical protein